MKTRIFYVYRGKSVKLNDLKNFVKKKKIKKEETRYIGFIFKNNSNYVLQICMQIAFLCIPISLHSLPLGKKISKFTLHLSLLNLHLREYIRF